jgi:hypothetical protein
MKTGKLLTGGGLTMVLNELAESGFIQKVYPYGKKEKDSLFRLTDEFSLFYFRFMQKREGHSYERDTWLGMHASQTYAGWCGYAFENICIKHADQIKKALQIGGINSTQSSWYWPGDKKENGAQIDLLIDRADRCINICEMKFSTRPFVIDKKYVKDLENKVMTFRRVTKTQKTLFLTFITTYGVIDNDYKYQRVDADVTMGSLFAP